MMQSVQKNYHPHLSKHQEADARECFQYHARIEAEDRGEIHRRRTMTRTSRDEESKTPPPLLPPSSSQGSTTTAGGAAVTGAPAASATAGAAESKSSTGSGGGGDPVGDAAAAAAARMMLESGSNRSVTTLDAALCLERNESTPYLSLTELQQAVMDLGLFPSRKEVEMMHERINSEQRASSSNRSLGGRGGGRGGGGGGGNGSSSSSSSSSSRPARTASSESSRALRLASDRVDVDEFLEMIKVLTLRDLSQGEMDTLYHVYQQYCDEDGRLGKHDLSALMTALGHPEDEVELRYLMDEWDVKDRGFLDFDAFLSMISAFLKKEELDVQVEADFKTFCRPKVGPAALADAHVDRERDLDLYNLLHTITPEDVKRVIEDRTGETITSAVAEELVFDADEDGSGAITIDELITAIEMISSDEVAEMEKTELHRGMQAIVGAKAR